MSAFWASLGWKAALLLTLAIALIVGGFIALIVAVLRDRNCHVLRPFDACVGRDCYRDRSGLTK